MPVIKYQNTKGEDRWYYQFYTGEIINGVRKKITKRGFLKEKDAKRAMIAAQADYLKGEYVEPSKKSCGEYFQEWLATRRNLSEETIDLYDSYFRTHINPTIGHIPLSKITAHDIEVFLNTLYEKGLAASTVKRIFSAVNASLNAAERKGIVTKNVADKVEKPQVKKRRELVVWEPAFVSEFLKSTREASRYWIAAYLAIMTGMRQGEILGLRWSDIDFEKRNITIQQTVTRKRKIKPGAKNKSSVRSIAISPETAEALREHRKLIDQERGKYKQNYRENDLVVCTRFGGPATQRVIQKMWNSLLKKTGAPKITFHDLRHTHASLLIKQGVHIKVISERLGHASVSITMDTYGHLMQNMQEDAATGLDAIISTPRTHGGASVTGNKG